MIPIRQLLVVFLLLVGIVPLVGCPVVLFGAAAGGGAAGENYTRETREKPTEADFAIMSALRARFERDNLTSDESINVLSINGIVTLGGKLKSQTVINHAIGVARATGGVNQVISNLQLRVKG